MKLNALAAAVAFFAAVPLATAGTARADGFRLTSPDIAEGKPLAEAQVFSGFGCTGGNTSPALSWSGAPAGTKSFVVTVYDPDAPTGSGWWHWVAFDLPASTSGLARGAGTAGGMPAGAVQARNDYGKAGFGGACPPPGAPHRYIFKVTALKVEKLGVDADASAALIGFMTNANALGSATITATYGR